MKKRRNNFEDIYPAGPTYVRGIRAGDTLFISGTTARGSDAQGGPPMDQLRAILDRITRCVAAEGGKPSDIVKMTTYVTDRSVWWPIEGEQVEIFEEFFAGEYPTNALVEVSGLAEDGLFIEIEAIAILD
jgi:2-iminobutanoate/2-iminopropanoate deaminase